ncbi:ABC transporter [Kineobactrum sediminis]|uniref:ABC transporter n=1 Tax=Kineobactrum sediminis TaxID=1905677 RepID=A0A2N5Y7D2_9GAMM|nr:ATP-binding cassette domain-containing protein [Kineobactrum sediminis]PLW84287.1 ABC transporter [Kineobactrum sediminis]
MLSVENAGRRVRDQWVWRGLDFRVTPGEAWAVSGPSGSGKTLLLRCLAALDPLDEGRILFEGRDTETINVPAYRARVLYLHQQPAFFEGTVEENLRAVLALAQHSGREFDQAWISGTLERLGKSPDFLQRPISALSGGEAQIVAFLRGLQISPTLLLLDEPTAALDPEAVGQIESLIEAWQAADPEHSLLWVSHDQGQLERMTSRRLLLGDG